MAVDPFPNGGPPARATVRITLTCSIPDPAALCRFAALRWLAEGHGLLGEGDALGAEAERQVSDVIDDEDYVAVRTDPAAALSFLIDPFELLDFDDEGESFLVEGDTAELTVELGGGD